jgi:MORN repeat
MPDPIESERIEKLQQLRDDAIHELEELLAMKFEEISILQHHLTSLRKLDVTDSIIVDPYGDQGLYTGQICNDKPNGKGLMKYEDGRVYDGEWCDGQWHGFGQSTFSNGDSYEGHYEYDQRHGVGTYRWQDGRVYSGTFQADKRHGKG